MKAKVLKYITLSMTFLVLFSSSGLGMYKHSCSMADHEAVNFQEKEPCCKLEVVNSDATVQLKQGVCCHSEKVLAKTTHKNQFKTEKKADLGKVNLNKSAFFKPSWSISLSAHILANFPAGFDPPPLSISLFLAFIQVYLI